ncbi:hypothetical protein Nepgr_003854 [Nepenthes gracilis]|uniref:Uncharacterized protein n=1 Tax=Nepenthes gracilis TaxID=150966 RepID=A0AAD3S0B3_NEPGR|nr:hypothetical protein Nepgr_003854 [Nepenthes gracilis]
MLCIRFSNRLGENKPLEQKVTNSKAEMLVDLESGDDVHAVPLAEEWSAEEVVNNPMLYAFQCLLGENESQILLKSIGKDT